MKIIIDERTWATKVAVYICLDSSVMVLIGQFMTLGFFKTSGHGRPKHE